MAAPTKEAIIGTFINGRNAQDDFLQLATNHGGTVFAWIDYQGILQGTFANSLPGGNNTDIQFNDSGVLGGSDNFTYNKSTQMVSLLSGNLVLSAGTLSITAGSTAGVVPATIVSSGNGPANVTAVALLITDGITPGVGTYFETSGNNFRIRNDSSVSAAHGDFNFTSAGVYLNGGNNSPTYYSYTGVPLGGYVGITNQSAQVDILGSGLFAITSNPGGGNKGEILLNPSTDTITFYGNVSGNAAIGTATACGTPNKINLPLTTGTAGQVLSTDGGNPQQTSWVTSPVEQAQIVATGLTANYNSGSAKTIFTPTAATVLRVTATTAITTAATTGAGTSVLPSLTLGYTDVGGVARTVAMLPTSSTNTTTVYETANELIYTNTSTVVTVTSASYASDTAAQMTYYLIVTTEVL